MAIKTGPGLGLPVNIHCHTFVEKGVEVLSVSLVIQQNKLLINVNEPKAEALGTQNHSCSAANVSIFTVGAPEQSRIVIRQKGINAREVV